MAMKIGHIVDIERLRNSAAGNPRWRLIFDGGSISDTVADSACNYMLSPAWIGKTIEFQTQNGYITHIKETR